jgi:hypothetical protein
MATLWLRSQNVAKKGFWILGLLDFFKKCIKTVAFFLTIFSALSKQHFVSRFFSAAKKHFITVFHFGHLLIFQKCPFSKSHHVFHKKPWYQGLIELLETF